MTWSYVDPKQAKIFGEVWRTLTRVLSDEGATQWLNTPHPLLEDQLPLDVVNSGQGYAVRNLAYLDLVRGWGG